MNRKTQPYALALVAFLSTHAYAQHYGAWGNAVPAPGVNMAGSAEGCPIESPDGQNLYFMSNRAGGQGSLDNWRATWNVAMRSWDKVTNLGAAVNSAAAEYCPTPLSGKRLLFVSSRNNSENCTACAPMPVPPAGSPPPGDIFLTRENPTHGWSTPEHLASFPAGPNTRGWEYSPSVVETDGGTLLFFSSDGYADSQGQDIYMSRQRADGSFGPGEKVAALSTPADDRMPNVRRDGLEIVFSSSRAGASQDIYSATRPDTASPWSPPQRIPNPAINTAGSETRATLSGDGTRLYFGRKTGATDPGDIYVSRRARLAGTSGR
jgi:Tol biopolymer transport system component